MGRSSAEATKASLIRAVRAVRAALAARLEVFFPLALAPGLTPDFAPALALLAWCALVALEAVGAVVESPEDCPAAGAAIISTASKPARQREADR